MRITAKSTFIANGSLLLSEGVGPFSGSLLPLPFGVDRSPINHFDWPNWCSS